MTQTEEAAKLRAYAKEQGQLARDLKAGAVEPLFYREQEERRGRKVRIHVPRSTLSDSEVQAQLNEAVRHAVEARRDANRKARDLDCQ